MKTKQEQIEEMIKILLEASEKCLDTDCNYCAYQYKKDCAQYRKAVTLVKAGYGDVSEYKAEIERLKAETSNIRRETAKEILDMLYDIGIDKETLKCCRIFDVNGVSLAKQICEKYGVEIEK